MGVRLNRLENINVPCQGAAGSQGRLCPQNPDPGSRLAFHLTLGEAF